MLDLAEVIAETAGKIHSATDHHQQSESTANKQALNGVVSPRAPEEPTTGAQNTHSNHAKVVFNDGTAAGVLGNLKDGTKTMLLHEADVTLKSMGLLLPSPADILPYRVDPFRSTLMTLHEKPGHFMRVLKKESINISGSKLNIFVSSL